MAERTWPLYVLPIVSRLMRIGASLCCAAAVAVAVAVCYVVDVALLCRVCVCNPAGHAWRRDHSHVRARGAWRAAPGGSPDSMDCQLMAPS